MNPSQNTEKSLQDCYNILGLPTDASDQEIKEAYFKLKNTFSIGNQALYSLADENYLTATLRDLDAAYKRLCQTKKKSEVSESFIITDYANNDFIPTSIAQKIKTPLIANGIKTKDPELSKKMQDLISKTEKIDGDLFKRLRELCQISPHEIQENIKISVTYIEYIEQNRFDFLPQPVYVKGFVTSYLTFLGAPDRQRLTDAYIGNFSAWLNQKNH